MLVIETLAQVEISKNAVASEINGSDVVKAIPSLELSWIGGGESCTVW